MSRCRLSSTASVGTSSGMPMSTFLVMMPKHARNPITNETSSGGGWPILACVLSAISNALSILFRKSYWSGMGLPSSPERCDDLLLGLLPLRVQAGYVRHPTGLSSLLDQTRVGRLHAFQLMLQDLLCLYIHFSDLPEIWRKSGQCGNSPSCSYLSQMSHSNLPI